MSIDATTRQALTIGDRSPVTTNPSKPWVAERFRFRF